MSKHTGLGRGLSALFGEEAVRDVESGGVSKLRISDIEPRSDQPRRSFDEVSLYELSESIKRHGMIQPLLVRKLPTGYYQIVAGERRWRAAKLAGLSEIPAVVYNTDDRHAMELALIENLQREDLNAIEEAEGFRALVETYGLTQEDVADRVGKSRPAVANSLRLLGLSKRNRELVIEGKLSAGHARALLSVSDPAVQDRIAKDVVNRDLSVRDTEALMKKVTSEDARAKPKPAPNYLDDYERRLSKLYGRKVKIQAGAKRGKVELEFYSPEDLDTLVAALAGEAGL